MKRSGRASENPHAPLQRRVRPRRVERREDVGRVAPRVRVEDLGAAGVGGAEVAHVIDLRGQRYTHV